MEYMSCQHGRFVQRSDSIRIIGTMGRSLLRVFGAVKPDKRKNNLQKCRRVAGIRGVAFAPRLIQYCTTSRAVTQISYYRISQLAIVVGSRPTERKTMLRRWSLEQQERLRGASE